MMKRNRAFLCVVLFCAVILCGACQGKTIPSATPPVAAAEALIPTETEVVVEVQEPTATMQPTGTPEPSPTPRGPLACNLTFDSDRDGNLEIYTMGPDGSNQVNLTNHPANDYEPVWAPDGSAIAFVSERETEGEGGKFIYVMDSDGANLRQLSNENDSQSPDWSMDGNWIAYTAYGDIFIIPADGSAESINLTNSEAHDQLPKISPDSQQIAWMTGEEPNRQIHIMDLDGSNKRAVTEGGNVHDLEWTVDGRIFTHWEQPDGICSNCVVSADGNDVIDGGGKGTIQEYLPFWTTDGNRVELIFGDIYGTGREDIILVGEIFPDIFLYLTNDAGNNRNPDAPALCGPVGASEAIEATEPAAAGMGTFTIGYETGNGNNMTPFHQDDLDRACTELGVQCVRGNSITDLADQGVDAILSFSNRWDVQGSYPQIHEVASQGIPLFVLNAETGEPGVYNLSAETEVLTVSLTWMFKEMGDVGEFVYFNFGGNNFHQNIIDTVLKDYPGIKATAIPAQYGDQSLTGDSISQLIKDHPEVDAIWANEGQMDIFWGMNDHLGDSQLPLTTCVPRRDMLEAWKERVDNGAPFRCIAFIQPGGVAYEGVYAAYYLLSGMQINPDALVGDWGNTLRYPIPVITNDTLDDWIAQLDTFREGMYQTLELPPMSAEEIRQAWFND